MKVAIKIEGLFKEYRLGIIGRGTLYRDFQSWWAIRQGKEDPNSLIGANTNKKVKNIYKDIIKGMLNNNIKQRIKIN